MFSGFCLICLERRIGRIPMIRITGKSKWAFDTSSSSNMSSPGVISLALATGSIYLTSPKGGRWHFSYRSVGVSGGLGVMWASGSDTDYPSSGQLYMLEAFDEHELTVDDIAGFCTIQDLSIAAKGGASLSVMFLGLDAKDVAAEIGIDGFGLSLVGSLLDKLLDELDVDWPSILQSSAKAMLIMGGVIQSGAGVAITNSVGYLE
jgi:hypothetical protein